MAPASIAIGGYKVPLPLLRRYVEQVLQWEDTPKGMRYEVERERERLHDELLEAIGLDRTAYPAYPNFNRALEDYISDMKPREDIKVHRLIPPQRIQMSEQDEEGK